MTHIENVRLKKTAVLTEQIAGEIRADRRSSGADLARKYGVTASAIYHVRKGRSWL
jgi:DNA-binding Xre family transcriptional regulator